MKLLITSFEFSDSRLPPTGGIGSFYNGYISDINKENVEAHFLGCSEKYLKIDDRKHVFGFYHKSIIRKACSHPNFIVILLTFLFDFIVRLRYSFLVKRYVKKHAIELIEAPDYKGVSSLFKLIGIKIPVVIRTHGTNKVLSGINVQKRHIGICFHEEMALRNCDGIVYISEASKKYLSEFCPVVLNKVSTLAYNYIHVCEKIEIKSRKSSDIINICYFGTLSDGKGMGMLFDVMFHMRDDEDIHFTLIGKSGDYFNELSNKNCYRELKNYTYLGPMNHLELQEKLEQFDFFIFPTKFENCPLSWFEAMANKKTILCSNIPVAREIIEDFCSGIICSDLNEYIKNIIYLKDENLRYSMGMNAYKSVMSKFSWNTCFNKSLAFYDDLINES